MSDRFGITGNYIVHSAKGTSWEKKDHKYVKKISDEGKNRYIYKAENGINYKGDREYIEGVQNGEELIDYIKNEYNIKISDPEFQKIYRKIIEAGSANVINKLGGNGMPSKIANTNIKKADKELNEASKKAAADKVVREINEDASKFDKYASYKTKGANGMPSNVANILAYKQKYKRLNYDPALNNFASGSSNIDFKEEQNKVNDNLKKQDKAYSVKIKRK